jgi:hypothetical protein
MIQPSSVATHFLPSFGDRHLQKRLTVEEWSTCIREQPVRCAMSVVNVGIDKSRCYQFISNINFAIYRSSKGGAD